ncbi:hypothetical protein Glove_212g115 [Diversispora epigaea]|uniref:G domain-containing protein n=1 Tax=Diversispora epigaea TaxID=1348612 RepID=A0A397II30_9GLOM|nr:hypothetical protein Glove_212g115 [Diversispora epigaea]
MSGAGLLQRCILAVGNTGLGKSFTATIFGAEDAKVGDSSESETRKITIHNIDGGFYIDTPGFDDSDDDKGDEETVRLIFFAMYKAGINEITTILWFVSPDVRAKGSYKRQAKFIELVAKDYNGIVWDNTIIVTKGDKIKKGPRDAGRAVAQEQAQKKGIRRNDLLSNTGNFKILLFESLKEDDDEEEGNSIYCTKNLTSDELNKYGVYKGSEKDRILAKYESLMKGHHEHPIDLAFRKLKCSKCREENDPRFAGPKCHQETRLVHLDKEWRHLGKVDDRHPQSAYWKHTSSFCDATTKEVKDQSFLCSVARVITVGIADPTKLQLVPGYWNCCKKNSNNSGCKLFYRCCDREHGSYGCQKFYDQCRHDYAERACIRICTGCEKDSDKEKGCVKICKVCEKDPHSTKGCSEVGYNDVNHDFHEP